MPNVSNFRDRAGPQEAGVDNREFRFTHADFRAIASILSEEAGISLPDSKASLVYARLARRLRSLNLTSFADYLDLLSGPAMMDERREIVTALTTNVTRFFREAHHFKHLQMTVLPALAARARAGARIRLWSAACSTGQEAYSIAAVVAETIPRSERANVKVLATDIDGLVLDQAESGRYESIDGVLPGSRRWFERDGNSWSVSPELHDLISFRQLNLNSTWPVRGPFDVIFCRNVAIYFDPTVQAALWHSFAKVIKPGGILYIGHSERVSGVAAGAFENVGITTYQRRSVDG